MALTGSRHRYPLQYPIDNLIRGNLLRLGLVADDDPVPQNVRGDGLDVSRDHVVSALQEGPGPGRQGQGDGPPGRGTVLNQRWESSFGASLFISMKASVSIGLRGQLAYNTSPSWAYWAMREVLFSYSSCVMVMTSKGSINLILLD
jgi:hypothetical protein